MGAEGRGWERERVWLRPRAALASCPGVLGRAGGPAPRPSPAISLLPIKEPNINQTHLMGFLLVLEKTEEEKKCV